ncbi:ComF family protein [Wohlfahrtiimonas larvae]|uniref:ComF family protein n=1 Tax=Wohlfahrtiimonas larvae TaxID=1157986 RepID=A0ABP9MD54_9GAMM|nr:ComF family protein [Wohlfahrtiimonas larvae]
MLKYLFQALYPTECFICHQPIDHGVLCHDCFSQVERCGGYCHYCCGTLLSGQHCDICEVGGHADYVDYYIFGYHYRDAMRDAIIHLKFNHKVHMVRVIKALMQPILSEQHAVLTNVDYIIPMPVDRVRLAGRGFNHMLEIVNVLQPDINKPILYDKLSKCAFSIPQSNLSRQARAMNLQNAFECAPISGRILLVDDVLTTGKTLQLASQALKNAGASSVTALVLSKA